MTHDEGRGITVLFGGEIATYPYYASDTWESADGAFDEVSEDIVVTFPAFSSAAVHAICVRATDGGNASPGSCVLLATYDPDGGFVTGGGWIDSPPGALPGNSTLIGKANFGFVSKYKRVANVPTGETEFQFQVANLNFRSSSYDWLVIAGARAQFKGRGTINAGDYGFMLTAIDGQAIGGGGQDKFRIKIYDRITNVILYDTSLARTTRGMMQPSSEVGISSFTP